MPETTSPYRVARETLAVKDDMLASFFGWAPSSDRFLFGKHNGQVIQEKDGVTVLMEDVWEGYLDGRTPQLLVPNATEGQYSGDGSSLLFWRYLPGRRAEIFTTVAGTAVEEKIADGDAMPQRWLPSGDVAYVQGGVLRGKNPRTGAQLEPPALQVRRPTPQQRTVQTYLYSPSGDKLTYGEGSNLWIMGVDGGQRMLITDAFMNVSSFRPNAAWSQDGTMLTYTSWLSDSGRRPQLWIAKNDGTSSRLVAQGVKGEFGRPSWFPDGQAIAFGSYPGGTQADILVARTDGSGFASVTTGRHPEPSPDGRKMVFLRGDTELWVAFLGQTP